MSGYLADRLAKLTQHERYCLKLGGALEFAAEHLADGYQIALTIEKHGGNVDLIDPDGETRQIDSGGDGAHDDIRAAVDIARHEDARNKSGG